MSEAVTPAPSLPPASLPNAPLTPRWTSAFEGVWLLTWRSKLTWRRLHHLLASVLLLPVFTYLTVASRGDTAYYHWTVNFCLMLVVPLHCLFTCGAMIRDEIQGDTMGFLLTRPLTRAQLFLLKYGCQMVWLEALAGLNGVLLLLAGWWRDVPGIGAFASVYLGTQVLEILAYGALSALLGLIHQRYLVLGVVYGFVVELGIGRIPTNINSLSLSHHFQTLLGNCTKINELYEWSPQGSSYSLCAIALAIALFLTLGAFLFTWREYHRSEEMQK